MDLVIQMGFKMLWKATKKLEAKIRFWLNKQELKSVINKARKRLHCNIWKQEKPWMKQQFNPGLNSDLVLRVEAKYEVSSHHRAATNLHKK